MTILEAQDLSKTYETRGVETRALEDIDLVIDEGEFTALAGPSGSGKTTLLNLLGALDEPSSGQVRLDGENLADLAPAQLSTLRLHKLGFIFQAYNLIPVLTAYENAEMVLRLQGTEERDRRDRVMAVLDDVGLSGLEDRRPDQLSGGQQQRVAIARAIASAPAVVLADEPTANVDSDTADRLLEIMEKLNRERGETFLFSTHDPRVLERARRVVRIVDGRIDDDQTRS